MADQIVTAYHKADWSVVRKDIVAKYEQAAKYYIDADVVGLIQREDGFKSVQALVEAGVCRLPFTPIMMEFSATGLFRWFILLEEAKEEEDYHIVANLVWHHFPTNQTQWATENCQVFMDAEGFVINGVSTNQDGHAACCAVCMALLLLNTKGIEKQVIHPTKLNAARAKSGKPPVPKVTTLRIGTVYDREGRGHGVGTVGMRRVHMRAGHTRRQHYGPGNSETKIIYVPPVLVNYRPELGGEKPALPEKRIKL